MITIQDILDKYTPWINQQERLYDEASVRSMLREYGEDLISEMISYRDPRMYTGPALKEKLKEQIQ